MKLKILPDQLAVTRVESSKEIPGWALRSSFFSITRTSEELSIVCEEKSVPSQEEKTEKNWRCLKVVGPLDFNLTGILSSLAKPLAEAKISIFAISTFDTDYLLVKAENLSRAVEVLSQSGFTIT